METVKVRREQKHDSGELSEDVDQAFTESYEFSKELGDEINIGKAKNTNFGLQVAAHRVTTAGTRACSLRT